jgi:hypothetical protein
VILSRLYSRRSLIIGLVSLVAAPAIVRASSLMPVKALLTEEELAVAFMRSPTIFPPAAAQYRAEFISAIEAHCASLKDWIPAEPTLNRPSDASGSILKLYEDAVSAAQS